MADKDFEEFSDNLDELPQHFRATDKTYQLVHAITPLEENKSFLEKVQLAGKLCGVEAELWNKQKEETTQQKKSSTSSVTTQVKGSSEDISDSDSDDPIISLPSSHIKWSEKREKKSRHQQQQPKSRLMPSFTKKCLEFHNCPEAVFPKAKEKDKPIAAALQAPKVKSLQEELLEAEEEKHKKESLSLAIPTSKGELETEFNYGDVDSGNSTNHSPNEDKNISQATEVTGDALSSSSFLSSNAGLVTIGKPLELLDPTHRGLHRFVPRHPDEIEIDIGDPVYVQREAEDLWCEGANLRSGEVGIFPLAHVVDVEYSDFDPDVMSSLLLSENEKKERFLLDYLGSVETSLYKGNIVLCQAVKKIYSKEEDMCQLPTVLQITAKGIKMQNKVNNQAPAPEYFFSLKNVTFCGFHPREPKLFGFVTKHPEKVKYACHVFIGPRSTQHVAEACGRAFQQFYQRFIDTAFPVEDIYLE